MLLTARERFAAMNATAPSVPQDLNADLIWLKAYGAYIAEP